MPKVLSIILQVFGSIAFVCLLGYFWGRWAEKHYAKKYEHDFRIMCFAVANEICSKTRYNYRDLLFYLDGSISCCVNYPEAEIDRELFEYYGEGNYRHFTYFTALKHCKYDEVMREKTEEYCKLREAEFHPAQERRTGQFCERKTKEALVYYAYTLAIWAVVFATLKAIFHF